MRPLFAILILLGFLTPYSSGQSNLDSLQQLFDQAKADDDISDLASKLFVELDGRGDYERALRTVETAMTRIQDKGSQPYAWLEYNKALTLDALGNTNESIPLYEGLIERAKSEGWGRLERNSRRWLGYNYIYDNNFELAIDVLNENLNSALAADHTDHVLRAYSDLGTVHYYTKNYRQTVNFWEKELASTSEDDVLGICTLKGNLGLVYIELDEFDKAEASMKEALELADSMGFHANQIDILTNLGKLEFERDNNQQAEEYLVESFEVIKTHGTLRQLANGYTNLGEILLTNRKFEKAKVYLDLGYQLAVENGINEFRANAYDAYADLYSEQGDFKTAFDYKEKSRALRDSILSLERIEQITELETKYKVRLKQDSIMIANQEIEIQKSAKEKADFKAKRAKLDQEEAENESERSQLLLVGSLVLLLMAGILIGVVVRSNRQRRLANELLAEQKTIIEIKNKDITDSIEYAKNLQTAILPDIGVIREAIPNYVLFYEPRDIVSGDFYWFHEKDDKVYLAAADCTGHGVPGAFVSMLCNDALNKVVVTLDESDPGMILSKVNETVIEAFRKERSTNHMFDGMDIALCAVDRSTRDIEFAGAMNRLVQIRGEEIIEHKGDRMPIGGRTPMDFKFTTRRVSTITKDCIYMFSDGFPDQFGGPRGKKFMIKRLMRMLVEIAPMKADRQKEEMHRRLEEWQGNYDRVDDVLVIGFEV